MTRVVLAAAALATMVVLGTAGCGSDGNGAGVGISLEVRHTEPLEAGAFVRWTLVLRNDTPNPQLLRFGSGKDGDMVLRQGGEEKYRWSKGRMFTTAVRDLRVGANETRTFAMEDPALDVGPGDYALTATIATDKAVPPLTEKVTVVA